MFRKIIPLLFQLFIFLNVGAQKTNTMNNLKAFGYAPVNGITMYYELYGDGEMPLVLIHGGGSTIESTFGNILPMLAERHPVIAVELQAHGRTYDRNAPETFEQDADDVAALLKYLKVNKADIFGFSNGGTTTLQIGIRHPEVVNKLIVVSGAYRRDGFIDHFFDGFDHATLDNMPESLKAAFLKVHPDSGALLNMFHKDVARMKAFTDIADESIHSIKAPTFVVINDLDVVTAAHAAQMMHTLANARLMILPGRHGSSIGAAESSSDGQTNKEAAFTAALVDEFLADGLAK
jgi:pimeloyl-ACP methyl ester carboxylesterase